MSQRNRLSAVSLAIIALAVLGMGMLGSYRAGAQSTGVRNGPTGMIFAGTPSSVCFEPTYNAGPDACVTRTGTGHISFTSGSLGTNADVAGTKTLAAGTGTVTFTNNYTVAPIVLCTDKTAAAAVACSASTSAITFTGTGTDIIQYQVIANPN